MLHTRALGHTGTLDPAASGVLCIAVGWALKLIRFLPHERKVYEAVVRLGQTTDTDDAEGRILAERPVSIAGGSIEAALELLTGDMLQRPPAYSALHIDGERAYAKARRGEALDLPARPVRVDRIELLWQALPRIGLRVTCGPGTYIRSLARDLGERLGCGAHLAGLRRTANGPFTIEQATPLAQIDSNAVLLATSEMLGHLPAFELDRGAEARIKLGQRIPAPGSWAGEVRLVDSSGVLQAVAGVVAGESGPKLQPLRVRPQKASGQADV